MTGTAYISILLQTSIAGCMNLAECDVRVLAQGRCFKLKVHLCEVRVACIVRELCGTSLEVDYYRLGRAELESKEHILV